MVKFAQIEVTTRCNLNCVFCCGRHFDQEDFSLDVYRQIIDGFNNLEIVHLQGEGEPFLHKDFFEMITIAKKKKIFVKTFTNGTFFSENNIVKILESGIDLIYVSIESSDSDIYYSYRGYSLQKIINGIKKLIKMRNEKGYNTPAIGFGVVVTKKTRNSIANIYDLYTQLGMDGGLIWQPLQKSEQYTQYYTEDIKKQVLSKSKLALLALECNELNKQLYIKPQIKELLEKENTFAIEDSSCCVSMRCGVFVNCKGYVVPCCKHKDYKLGNYGNLYKDSIEDIVNKRNQVIQNYREGKLLPACIMNQCYVDDANAQHFAERIRRTPKVSK